MLAFKYEFDEKTLDFDVSNMSISEFWIRLLETDYLFHSAIEQNINFFSAKIKARNFFRKKKQPQNIKWTVPKENVLSIIYPKAIFLDDHINTINCSIAPQSIIISKPLYTCTL